MQTGTLFGKLTPYNTFVHRMDARLKIFILIALMVVCFLPYSNFDKSYYVNQFIVLGVAAIIVIFLMIVSRVSLRSFLKSMGALWFMMIFLLIIMVFIPQTATNQVLHPIHDFGNGYTIYWNGVLQCAQVFLRIILMIGLTMVLTSTTAPMDITYAFEWYLTPLRWLHVPTQIVSMILSLAIRMIPTILEETQRIMKAQRSRGVDFNRGFLISKIKSVTTLIVPLLVSCFSRSDDLSLAMYARGYDPYSKRSNYKVLKFHFLDFISVILALAILAGFIFLCVEAQAYKVNFIGDWFGGSTNIW